MRLGYKAMCSICGEYLIGARLNIDTEGKEQEKAVAFERYACLQAQCSYIQGHVLKTEESEKEQCFSLTCFDMSKCPQGTRAISKVQWMNVFLALFALVESPLTFKGTASMFKGTEACSYCIVIQPSVLIGCLC